MATAKNKYSSVLSAALDDECTWCEDKARYKARLYKKNEIFIYACDKHLDVLQRASNIEETNFLSGSKKVNASD